MFHNSIYGSSKVQYSEKVRIYREGQEVEVLESFEGKKRIGEEIMPGMELPLEEMMIKK